MGSRAVALAVALVATLALATPGSASHFRFREPELGAAGRPVGQHRRLHADRRLPTLWLLGHGGRRLPCCRRHVAGVHRLHPALSGRRDGDRGPAPVRGHVRQPDPGLAPGDGRGDETLVDLSIENSSPRSALPPLVSCELGTVCRFVALALDPDDDPLRWRLSDPCEAAAGCGFTQPGPPHAPNALSVDPDDGLVTWDTTGATIDSSQGYGLYSTQITIEDLDEDGAVKSKTAVDFFIRVAPVPPFAPRFETPPTPADGAIFRVGVGEELEFEVVASDPDAGDVVTLGDSAFRTG